MLQENLYLWLYRNVYLPLTKIYAYVSQIG